jgi:hypothetical protein
VSAYQNYFGEDKFLHKTGWKQDLHIPAIAPAE